MWFETCYFILLVMTRKKAWEDMSMEGGAAVLVYVCAGTVNQKVLPFPTSLSTPIEPPWASTANLQKVKPSRWKYCCRFCCGETWPNFSKILSLLSLGIPGPVSLNIYAHTALTRFETDGDASAVRRELQCVPQQVLYDARKQPGIAEDSHWLCCSKVNCRFSHNDSTLRMTTWMISIRLHSPSRASSLRFHFADVQQ